VIDGRRNKSTLTAAIRVFILNYFRSAATNISHIRSEHGMRDTNGSGLERNLLFGDPGGGPGLREGALPLSYSLE
jgi:hypothetical protein